MTSCATWLRTSRPLTSDAQSPGRVRLDVGAGEAGATVRAEDGGGTGDRGTASPDTVSD
jgi:hypothetical protein